MNPFCLIVGTMGVGKSAVCRELKYSLPNSASLIRFFPGWCLAPAGSSPFP